LFTSLTAVLHGASSAQGVLEVRLKDHREAIGDFSRFTLKLGTIGISSETGLAFWRTGWRELPPSVQAVDLTRYTGKESVAVFTAVISTGSFDAIRLGIAGIEAISKKSGRPTSVKNSLTPIKLSFAIEPEHKTVIILDLVVVDMSDHPPRGYELGIKGYELYTNEKLVDKIPPG
jgi:hypothetical protein